MTNKPEISVVVVNHNHGLYIKEAVESILWQTKSEYEIIIVDNSSTDNSKDEIEEVVKLDDRIQTPIYLESNKGKWFALNMAIKLAKSKIITINDANDVSCRHRLERQFKVLKDFNSFHNLCGFHYCYNEKDVAMSKRWTPNTSGQLTFGYDVINHEDVTKSVFQGYKTSKINRYFIDPDYEIYNASSMFYKQLWENGVKFLPNNMDLRCLKTEYDDHNVRMTLLLQKTSVLKEPLCCYRT